MNPEQISFSLKPEFEKPKLDEDRAEVEDPEKLEEQYRQLNKTRLNYEEDAGYVHSNLLKLLSDNSGNGDDVGKQLKIDKLKSYLELDEQSLSYLEFRMAEVEFALNYKPNWSKRFDNSCDDMLIFSAVFFEDRINNLRVATNNPDIDKPLVEATIRYAESTQNGENTYVCATSHQAIRENENRENCQKHRSISHNAMICELDKLNDLARKLEIKPLTYRNLIQNSAVNNYSNDTQMYHDRVTAAKYVSEAIWLGGDSRYPDPKYVK